MQDQVGLVLDDPFDDFALGKLHGLSDRGGEVDVPLRGAVFSGDELNLGGMSHARILL